MEEGECHPECGCCSEPLRSNRIGGQVISRLWILQSPFFAFFCSICCIMADSVIFCGVRCSLWLALGLHKWNSGKRPEQDLSPLRVRVRVTVTMSHPAWIVRKLSDCHDSIPTGYELIWTHSKHKLKGKTPTLTRQPLNQLISESPYFTDLLTFSSTWLLVWFLHVYLRFNTVLQWCGKRSGTQQEALMSAEKQRC